MPTLNWIGKDAIVKHHLEVPFHLLKDVPELSCGDPGTGNIIAQGDNLIALKALLPHFAGQVKCVCIDPPYNTGNEGWAYNDNVNSPVIREWLGKVVGKEGETLDRHDRWLCMMYPRLALLRQFLSEDGSIFVCLDDNEIGFLKPMMDEIFGAMNFVAQIIWQKKYARQNDSLTFSTSHDYILSYARSSKTWRPNSLSRTQEQTKGFKNPDNDPRGVWQSVVYTCGKSRDERPNLYYPIKNPITGRHVYPLETRVWGCDERANLTNQEENRLWWGVRGELEKPRKKVFLSELNEGVVPDTIWFRDDVGDTQDSRREILDIFGDGVFQTPKPSRLIERILEIATKPGDLILDSFSGSGTTGHAVLKMNAAHADKDPRRFIMIELESDVCRNITAERVRRVAEGYTNAKGEKVEGLGGGFRFCELGEPLFDETGHIRETVKFGELARHVYFSETREPLPRERVPNTPLLGVCRGLAVYLLFNGILGDKSSNGGNVLTRKTLAKLPPFVGPKVIYCAGCLIGAERLAEEGITVRQTPYEIRVS